MSEPVIRKNRREPCLSKPYTELYIYYIGGRLKNGRDVIGDDFIGNWEEGDFSFLFFSKASDEKVEKLLSEQPRLTLIDKYHMTYDQWQGGTLSPFKAGSFFITPPWHRINSHNNEWLLVLDPGVVFGAGTHPTTRDCLKALECVYSETKPRTVLDLGTGTGLLAIASQRLGCRNTLAVDVNFLAAQTAKRNIRFNGLEKEVLVVQGRAENFINFPSDLVIANIHYDVMKHLVTSDGFFRKKWFILSGLLRSEARHIADKLTRNRVNILKRWHHDGIWHTFLGKICR